MHTRNRIFLVGLLLILLGVQFRMVQSFVLGEPATRMLAKVADRAPAAEPNNFRNFMLTVHPRPTKTVSPPRWIGFALIATGSVLTLHAVAMPKE